MAKGMPSMIALLGLLAVAGYQNRDKIADALGGAAKRAGDSGQDGLGGVLSGLGGLFGGAGADGNTTLTGGLGELMDRFKSSGHGAVADSWVTPGVPTEGLSADQVESAVGAETLDELSQRTGLSRAELLQRLATAIPSTVDRLTPGGRMPSEDEARAQLLQG